MELHARKWIPRNAVAATMPQSPTTTAAALEAAANERDMHSRMSTSRGESRYGGNRDDHGHIGLDWRGAVAPKPPAKAGDLSNFGTIEKTPMMPWGPNSVFKGKKDENLRDSAGTRSMFDALWDSELATEAVASEDQMPATQTLEGARQEITNERDAYSRMNMSRGGSQRRGRFFGIRGGWRGGYGGGWGASSTAAPQPGSLSISGFTEPDPSTMSLGPSGDLQGKEAEISEEETKKRVEETSKKLFSTRDLKAAETYFAELPSEHRWRFVDQLVRTAVESQESDAQLVTVFFGRIAAKKQCSPASFEEGFTGVAEILRDIAVDKPNAFELMAIMMKGARLDQDEERRIASKATDSSSKLLSLLS